MIKTSRLFLLKEAFVDEPGAAAETQPFLVAVDIGDASDGRFRNDANKTCRSDIDPIVATRQAWQSSLMSMWRQIIARLRRAWVGHSSVRERIPDNLSDEVPLDEIQKVTFFKRDELTTDLICCDIEGREQGWFFHEEAEGWDNLVRHLERLPNFQRDWYQEVVQPPFATCETVAFSKS